MTKKISQNIIKTCDNSFEQIILIIICSILNINHRIVSLNIFLPYTKRLVFAFKTTAIIISKQPAHPPGHIINPIPIKYNQNARECHLLAEYMLISPTNCNMKPKQFRIGTTRVSGSEKEERIEVTVEIQTEVQAPPEQMLRGIDREEKMFKLAALCLWSTIEQKTKAAIDEASRRKHFLCLTSHLLSSNPAPYIPPSFLTTFVSTKKKQSSRVYEIIYFALSTPRCVLRR